MYPSDVVRDLSENSSISIEMPMDQVEDCLNHTDIDKADTSIN